MTWSPPDWMNAEDRERCDQLLEAKRAEVRAMQARVDRAASTEDLIGWRWRCDALIREAAENIARLETA